MVRGGVLLVDGRRLASRRRTGTDSNSITESDIDLYGDSYTYPHHHARGKLQFVGRYPGIWEWGTGSRR